MTNWEKNKEGKACIFDLDGVIVDTAIYHFQAWRKLAQSLGFDFTHEQNEQLKGISRVESLNLILKWGNVVLSEDEKLHWATQKNNWYLDLIEKMTPKEILPGVKNFLDFLKENEVPIILGSASKNAKSILNKVDLLHFFDVVIDGNSVTKSKPNPEVFLAGALKLNMEPEKCIVFEDAVAGIQAAKAAKMRAIGIGQKSILFEADEVFKSFVEMNYKDLFDF